MRLIKLTTTGDEVVYVSADKIISCKKDGPSTRTYPGCWVTLDKGVYYRVTQEPEEIERVANS